MVYIACMAKETENNQLIKREPLITIVVPIYNVERFLRQCLDSIVNQSDTNFKVVLVNDGTKDSSGEIALEYKNQYPELFEYVEQENKGLGGARNTGLDLVKTKYVRFIDSDDFMALRTMESLNKELENLDVDILLFNPPIYDMVLNNYQIWYDREYLGRILKNDIDKVFNPHDYPELMDIQANVCRCVWRTDFLKENNFKFIEHVYWEDVPAHFYLFHVAKTAKVSDVEGAYYYRTNSGNQITATSGKNRLDMKYIFAEILPYFKSKERSVEEKIYMISFLSDYMLWSIRVISDEYLPRFIKISHKFYRHISLKLYLKFFFKTKCSLKHKLLIWFLKSGIHYKSLMSKAKINKKMRIFKRIKKVFKKAA